MLAENPYLIDSDIYSYILKHKDPVDKVALENFHKYKFFRISEITYYEILRGLKANPNLKLLNENFNKSLKITRLVSLDRQTLEIAAEIYSYLRPNGDIIGELDILIGATAVANNYTLVTNNIKHYEKIQKYTNLKIENWMYP